MMDRRRQVRELRDKVDRYRKLARELADDEAAKRILALTDELEQQARDIELGK